MHLNGLYWERGKRKVLVEMQDIASTSIEVGREVVTGLVALSLCKNLILGLSV